jgi:phage replication O-like protein O
MEQEKGSKKEGNFSAVPNEMIEILMRTNLTTYEFRVVWFFIRVLQGHQKMEVAIKTAEIIYATALPKQRVIPALNSLITKGIIQRFFTIERGIYGYRFNADNFGRIHATKRVRQDKKFLHLVENEGHRIRTLRSQNQDLEVTESGPEGHRIRTSPSSNPLSYSIKENKYILKREEKEELNAQVKGTGNGIGNGNLSEMGDPSLYELNRRRLEALEYTKRMQEEEEKGKI